MELMGERAGAIAMRLFVHAFRPRQWKSNISCMFCTSSPLGCATKKLGQTYPTGDVSASPSSTGAADVEIRGYTVIREGEAKILMPSCNTVFYNKAQVNNRDISIAVLRAFISRSKEEYAARLNINERFKNEEKEDYSKESQELKAEKSQVERLAPLFLRLYLGEWCHGSNKNRTQ
ncbi:putative tRNA (guanine(26)-N(2))-dimethyltransferase 1 [Platanthera zijinensis]|uniref:tRNA (Guanine(26)-N(2))-dimethyltransferase 1 n=1 Tax=Platanthera zijinensis TaxID=2320716 RepID=A0AAP0G1U3_9ASPA